MKVYIVVKETKRNIGVDTYWEHENVEVFVSKQDADFELKYTYKNGELEDDVCFSIEVMELVGWKTTK